MGLAPSLLYLVAMGVHYFNVPLGHRSGEALMVYSTLMPVFAAIWLRGLTWNRAELEFDRGPSMSRRGYVLGLLGANSLVWFVFVLLYLVDLRWV
jgi:hypothetical protein